MTAIHHATAKKIAKAGCTITENEHGTFVLRMEGEPVLRAVHDDPKWLAALAAQWAEGENTEDYEVEYDAEADFEDDGAMPSDEVTDDEVVESIEDEDDEEQASGSIVKPKYKALYKERGTIDNCGDDLATLVRSLTRDDKDVLDQEALTRLAELNGINDWRKYLTGKPSDIGRMSMNIRNRLRTIARKNGGIETPHGFQIVVL